MTQYIAQTTAKNAILTLSSAVPGVFQVPVPLVGAGVEDWLSFDDIENAVVEAGLDGTKTVYIKNVINKGKLVFLPTSPSLSIIRKIQGVQKNGLAVPCILNINSPTGLWSIKLSNFIITSAFKGFELGDKVKDVSVSFASDLPELTILGDISNVGLNIAAALGSL